MTTMQRYAAAAGLVLAIACGDSGWSGRGEAAPGGLLRPRSTRARCSRRRKRPPSSARRRRHREGVGQHLRLRGAVRAG